MDYQCSWEVFWIDSAEKLAEFMPKLRQAPILSIDTETWGWQTGNETLCLIQIGLPESEQVLLVDPLAGEFWLELEEILSAPAPLLIAHNASFEQKQFARHKLKMRGAVDTLKQARKLRPDLPNKTLKTCVKYVLGVQIGKEEQVSDWSRRPLTEEQQNYAAVDAEITYKLYSVFAEMEAELALPDSADVPALMAELQKTEQSAHLLLKDIASQLELLKLRKEMLKEAIRSKLIEGAPAYQGDYGKASIKEVKRSEISPQKVRELLPELAERAIVESVQRKRLEALLDEYDLNKKTIDEVSEFLRFDYRLELSIAD